MGAFIAGFIFCLFCIGIYALCRASGDADRHAESLMNDKEDKEGGAE